MRILKQGTVDPVPAITIYSGACTKCKCEFECTGNEVVEESHFSQRYWDKITELFVYCPTCRNRVMFSRLKEKQ